MGKYIQKYNEVLKNSKRFSASETSPELSKFSSYYFIINKFTHWEQINII